MSFKKHGITIGIERVEKTVFMSMKAVGKLTHADYETITPMLESAIDGIKEPKVNVY
jgi:hypothetical protein